MPKVQNTESLLFILDGTSYSVETAELLLAVLKACVVLCRPSVSFRGTAIRPLHPSDCCCRVLGSKARAHGEVLGHFPGVRCSWSL